MRNLVKRKLKGTVQGIKTLDLWVAPNFSAGGSARMYTAGQEKLYKVLEVTSLADTRAKEAIRVEKVSFGSWKANKRSRSRKHTCMKEMQADH